MLRLDALVAQTVKASAYNAGDLGLIPGLGRSSGEGKWEPTPVLLPGNPMMDESGRLQPTG